MSNQAALFKPLKNLEDTIGECREFIKREHAARECAEAANRQKDEFLIIIAHELRNPMNSIIGWLEMLQGEKLNEPTTKRAIEAIKRGVKLQAKILEDLFDVSRISTGKLRLNLHEIEVAPVLERVLNDFKVLAEAKQIEIKAIFSPNLGRLTADSYRLEQVLWNLLSNAVKFTANGGKIRVTAERQEFHLEIAVSDTGQGIDSKFLPFIFEPFRQAEHSVDERRDGLGLGLSIVRRIIELHGGSIKADSVGCGQGAVFTIRLPENPTAVNEAHQRFRNSSIGDGASGLL